MRGEPDGDVVDFFHADAVRNGVLAALEFGAAQPAQRLFGARSGRKRDKIIEFAVSDEHRGLRGGRRGRGGRVGQPGG